MTPILFATGIGTLLGILAELSPRYLDELLSRLLVALIPKGRAVWQERMGEGTGPRGHCSARSTP